VVRHGLFEKPGEREQIRLGYRELKLYHVLDAMVTVVIVLSILFFVTFIALAILFPQNLLYGNTLLAERMSAIKHFQEAILL